MTDFLHCEIDDGVALLTLQRPEVYNALHPPACVALGQMLDDCERDDAVRVVIVTGEGDKAFCAGFDLQYAQAHPEVYQDPMIASEAVRRPQHRKPMIAAVNGLAMGLGFELALACDLIVASRHAKFALPEAKVGLVAMAGGVVRLTREIGPKQALALALTGDSVSAETALALGFVNEVTDGPAVDAARRWARRMLACAPLALAASLEMSYRSRDLPLQDALDPRRYPAALRVLDSSDAAEGRQAFIERRPPRWQGR